MKKLLLLTFLVSFIGFSQNDNFISDLKKSDTIKAFRKRSKVIRKIIDKEMISKIITREDTLSLDYNFRVDKKGKLIYMSKSSDNENINLIGSQLFNQKNKVKVKRFTDKYNNPPFDHYDTDYNIYLLIDNKYVNAANKSVPFAKIEKTPVFPGCKGNNLELRTCMNAMIKKHINTKFNIDIAQNLGLSAGRKKINVQFIINEKGFISDVKARAPHPKLEKEAIRIIKLLPIMIPGKQKGEPVKVRYNLPIVFRVEKTVYPETKFQKKLRKKAERRKKKYGL